MYVTFAAYGHIGHIVDDNVSQNKIEKQALLNVTCLPLYSILLALDNPTIDYFSLDVEGQCDQIFYSQILAIFGIKWRYLFCYFQHFKTFWGYFLLIGYFRHFLAIFKKLHIWSLWVKAANWTF